MTLTIDIWSDVACPWCLIGKRRFEKALAQFPQRGQVTVTWRSFQLDPTLPEHDDRSEVDYLVESKGIPRASVEQMIGQVAAVMENRGGEGPADHPGRTAEPDYRRREPGRRPPGPSHRGAAHHECRQFPRPVGRRALVGGQHFPGQRIEPRWAPGDHLSGPVEN